MSEGSKKKKKKNGLKCVFIPVLYGHVFEHNVTVSIRINKFSRRNATRTFKANFPIFPCLWVLLWVFFLSSRLVSFYRVSPVEISSESRDASGEKISAPPVFIIHAYRRSLLPVLLFFKRARRLRTLPPIGYASSRSSYNVQKKNKKYQFTYHILAEQNAGQDDGGTLRRGRVNESLKIKSTPMIVHTPRARWLMSCVYGRKREKEKKPNIIMTDGWLAAA